MKKSTRMILMGALIATGLPLYSNAAVPTTITENVPGTMNYQGRLVDPSGTSYVNGTYTFDIRLYTVANGGTAIWGGTYSAYVKDGYFNIMLGASGGQALSGTTYAHTELWKALWPDSANGNAGDSLYLGVTPWQGSNGATLSTKVELTPRQTLMTAPYAFRAQTADSAKRADAGFDVTGTIVADDITIDGEMLSTSGTSVMVGGPNGNTTANYVNINAYGVDIDSGVADIYLNSSDRIDVNATGYYDLDAGSVQVDATSGTLDLESQNYTYLKGKSGVYVQSSTGAVNLQPNTQTQGQKPIKWKTPSASSQYYSPIIFNQASLTFGAGYSGVSGYTGYNTDDWTLSIVGIRDVVYGAGGMKDCFAYENSGFWYIQLSRDKGYDTSSSASSFPADTVTVEYMVINNNFVNDAR